MLIKKDNNCIVFCNTYAEYGYTCLLLVPNTIYTKFSNFFENKFTV